MRARDRALCVRNLRAVTVVEGDMKYAVFGVLIALMLSGCSSSHNSTLPGTTTTASSVPPVVPITAGAATAACRGVVGNGSGASVADVIVTLNMVGGRAPGLARPVAGRVVATDPAGRRCTQAVGPSGELDMTVAPNSYSFTGYSPSYGDGAYTCHAEKSVKVREHSITFQGPPPRVDVVCPVR